MKLPTRQRLSKYDDWNHLVLNEKKEDENYNVSKALHDLKEGAKQDIDDLILLASKLDSNDLKDIFEYTKINTLLNSIMFNQFSNILRGKKDIWRLELASLLVEIGINMYISYYKSEIESHPILNQSTIEKLETARDICEVMSYKAKLPELSNKKNKEYLFNWNKISNTYNKKYHDDFEGFLNFCRNEIPSSSLDLNYFEKHARGPNEDQYYEEVLSFKFDKIDYYEPLEGGEIISESGIVEGYIYINKINFNLRPKYYTDKNAYFCLLDKDGDCYYKRTLPIEVEGENVYLYKKYNDTLMSTYASAFNSSKPVLTPDKLERWAKKELPPFSKKNIYPEYVEESRQETISDDMIFEDDPTVYKSV